jgi:putative SOS response-associated peptidase YedK
MCGRLTLRCEGETFVDYFGVPDAPILQPRFNIAPGQDVPVVRIVASGATREVAFLRWGLVPSWAKDVKVGFKAINARAETAPEKPTFRAAFQKRRCVLAADGFYEWRKEGKKRKPFHFSLADGQPFAIAGLWECWEKGETPLETCTLLTTTANELVQPLHDRMPVILPAEHLARWLDPDCHDVAELLDLMQPFPAARMRSFAVSTRVNYVRNDDPECLLPEGDLFSATE